MRPSIHIALSKPEQAYLTAWRRRVLAGCAFAVVALLTTVLLQHLVEQNTGSLAQISPPEVAENTSPFAPE